MSPRNAATGLRAEAGRIRHPPQQLAAWGIAYGSGNAWTVALVTAELAANAITHGRLPDRDFRLALGLLPHAVRIEVTDTRPERLLSNLSPALPDATAGAGSSSSTRTHRWGCTVHDTCTKTVCAEVDAANGTQASEATETL